MTSDCLTDPTMTDSNITMVTANFDMDISGTSKNDVTDLWLIDAAFTTISDSVILLLLDHFNMSIKCCRIGSTEHVISAKRLPGNPCKMALLDSHTVVITLPRESCLCVLDISLPGVAHIRNTVLTMKSYWGLTSLYGDTLLAGTVDMYPVAVDMLDLKGNVLKTFTTDIRQISLFCRPDYLKWMPNGDMLLSDWGQSAVLCLNKNRELRFRFERNGNCRVCCPVGVDCDDQGNIYIADRDADTVIVISPEGDFIQTLLTQADGVISPLSLTIQGTKLCITLERGDVKIFDLK